MRRGGVHVTWSWARIRARTGPDRQPGGCGAASTSLPVLSPCLPPWYLRDSARSGEQEERGARVVRLIDLGVKRRGDAAGCHCQGHQGVCAVPQSGKASLLRRPRCARLDSLRRHWPGLC